MKDKDVARKIIQIIDAYESCDSNPTEAIEKYCLQVVEKEEPVSENLLVAANKAWQESEDKESYAETFIDGFVTGTNWQKEQMIVNTADATIGLPYENKDGGYTHLIDVSRPLPVGNNKIAIIFKEK